MRYDAPCTDRDNVKIARALIANEISSRVPHLHQCRFRIKFAFTSGADDRLRWTKIDRRPHYDLDSIRGCAVVLNLRRTHPAARADPPPGIRAARLVTLFNIRASR